MENKEYLNQIIRFNSDKDILMMREKYNVPSFFEIISKERSETTFSSFLKWLFSSNKSEGTSSPLMMLLDILVRRGSEQQEETILIPENLKKRILSRKIKIQSLKVYTEQPVSTLAREVFDALCKNNRDEYTKGYNTGWDDYPSFKHALQIASNSQDRIDLLIDCDIVDSEVDRKLQIIIENKIDSKEGGAKKNKNDARLPKEYFEASQTGRYYLGSHRTDNNAGDVYQLYVYLTPLPSDKLDKFKDLKERESKEIRDDEHFIQINYQDILDSIIVPLLHSKSLSNRSRFFLEEFKNELTYPNVESKGGASFIAVSEDASEDILNNWEKYKELIINSAVSAIQEPIWCLEGTYYNYQPKAELLAQMISRDMYSQLQQKGWVLDKQDKHFNKAIDGSHIYFSSRTPYYSSIEQFAQQTNIDIHRVKFPDTAIKELLSSFWEGNRLFLSALMNGLPQQIKKDIQCIIDSLAKRDTSKYMIYYNNQPICDQPMNNVQTVWCIVYKWVKLQPKAVSLEELNKAFPRNISHYYESGKWYKHLFVQKETCTFDGENGNGQIVTDDCWDIDWSGKYDILLANPTMTLPHKYATMLKMWRRDDTEKFINYAKKKPEFKDKLSVVKER